MRSGSCILDVGCGNGRIAIHLAKHGFKVVGIDISPLYIRDASRRAREFQVEDRVEFVVGDAREVDSILREHRFDAALMYWTSMLGYYVD